MYAQEMEGFTPLRKAVSEPVAATQGRYQLRRVPVYRGPDYLGAKLTGLSARLELDGEEWKPVKRMASFTKQSERIAEESESSEEGAVVVVDPFSTGAILATRAVALGYRVVRVLSDGDSPVASLVADGVCVDYEATIVVDGTSAAAYDGAAEALKALPYGVVALMAGAETGVLATDELAARLGLRGNEVARSKARRNKYVQGEVVRGAGSRAVAQRAATTWEEARGFLEALVEAAGSESIYPVVVKPVESAGSDDVFKCASGDEVKQAVERVAGKVNGLGVVNEAALVQEFLSGTEYVVDGVSRDGEYKVVAIWKYDKRAANGANFVYHGMSLVDPLREAAIAGLLVDYSRRVLAALGITQGPSHMEVMVSDEGEACLVEVGARCHGGEGSWSAIARACVVGGYDQVDATLKAYLDGEAFAALPATPAVAKAGAEIFFVNRLAGVVRSTDKATAVVRRLESFQKIEWQLKPGDFAALTVDCFTRPGSAQLVHADATRLAADCAAIRDLELLSGRPKGLPPLLDLELVCRVPIDKGTVVVVDPYSSGAVLAARVRAVHRKKLLVVHSDPNSPVASLVASGAAVSPHHVVAHAGDPDQTAEACVAHARAIVACIPGAETGVLLADQLAERLGTRANPTGLSAARRNKFLMGEAVRAAGVRAVAQTKAATWPEAKAFLDALDQKAERRFPLVVKPVESAGSDDVFKCHSEQDVKDAVEHITGKINGLGNANDAALVQEFLRGDEYVVDAVSRDGVHKVVAIWKYDKRSVNGANFVYFGMSLVDFFGDDADQAEIARILAAYADDVRDALQITDGPSHMEVKLDPETRRPCLVEVGARCHGAEGFWISIAKECCRDDQATAALDAYLDPARFDERPPLPPPTLHASGCIKYLLTHKAGTLQAVDQKALATLTSLPSYRGHEIFLDLGKPVIPTKDCFSWGGCVKLTHLDQAQRDADYAVIARLCLDSLWIIV